LKAANEDLSEQLAIAKTLLYQKQLADSSGYGIILSIRPLDSLFMSSSGTGSPDSIQDQSMQSGDSDIILTRKAIDTASEYQFISARVVGNSTIHRHNYMILNRGSLHGIKPRMGVVGPRGAVGIVDQVSENFCSIITLIHSKARLSAGLAKKDAVGTLFWEGGMIHRATLLDIPMHVPVKKGDTVYTSAYSLTFPSGVPVGRVRTYRIPDGESVYRIGVDLFTDFRSVQYVHLIDYRRREERLRLEDKITTDD
jgi:cell shape-determining protein MreC